MYRFIETIKIKNAQAELLPYHQERFNQTRQYFFPEAPVIKLQEVLEMHQQQALSGVFKCRIVYGREIEHVEIHPYTLPSIQTLRMVEINDFDYRWKYKNREAIRTAWQQRQECDDVLMLREGHVTDTSYCNVALLQCDGRWITPEKPLLQGTRRQLLIDRGIIQPAPVTRQTLASAAQIKLFNAMISWDEAPEPGMVRE